MNEKIKSTRGRFKVFQVKYKNTKLECLSWCNRCWSRGISLFGRTATHVHKSLVLGKSAN